MKRSSIAALVLGLVGSGCSAINVASLPSDRSGSTIFLSAGDIPEAYETLGAIQVKRSGLILFGFWDVVHTDIDYGLAEVLTPEIRKLGGDGAINVRFRQTQYLTVTKALFAFPFFFIPLPSEVVITAEVVRLKHPAAAGPTPLPPATAQPAALTP